MTASVPFAPDFAHLVYMRVFEGCNLHCEHCFIPKNPKRMTHESVREQAEGMRRFVKPGDTILIQWHGGEPTMFGSEWLEHAMDVVEEALPNVVVRHGLQTNLMTYNAGWGDLYRRRFDGTVGVSWDPVIRLMTRGRPESNAAYEEHFAGRLSALIEDGIEPYLVVTATRVFLERFRNPIEFFEHLIERGVRRAHIERLTETGYARENWERLGVDNAAWSDGMARFLRAYELWRTIDENGAMLALSPFDGLVGAAATLETDGAAGYGCWSGSCDTRFHTIDASGYKPGCTALTSESDNRAAKTSLPFSRDFAGARKRRRVVNCAPCPYKAVCSSGCLAVSMDDGSGECSGGRRLFEAAESAARRRGVSR